jgi:hypothetical protein
MRKKKKKIEALIEYVAYLLRGIGKDEPPSPLEC